MIQQNINKNELTHHGVKGMRWGVRRYQNQDGSLTPAGEERYRKLAGREQSASRGSHGKTVLTKYESKKSDELKRLDKAAENTRNRLNQFRFDKGFGDDFDFMAEVTRPGSKLGKLYNQALNAQDNRARAYMGQKWVDRYFKELGRAYDKDHREVYKSKDPFEYLKAAWKRK